MRTYIEKRQLVVDKARELVKSIYPKDPEMERLIEGQIQTFESITLTPRNEKTANAFVEGLLGFVQWCKTQSTRKVEDGEILTTFIHDLREYNCNRREAWFSPRSAGYRKFYTEEPEEELVSPRWQIFVVNQICLLGSSLDSMESLLKQKYVSKKKMRQLLSIQKSRLIELERKLKLKE